MKRIVSILVVVMLVSNFAPAVPAGAANQTDSNSRLLSAAVKKKLKKKKKKIRHAKSKAPQKATSAPARTSMEVLINNRTLDQTVINELKKTYGGAVANGNYWYDKKSGAYGRVGEGMITFLKVGHDFGEMSADASGGSTGVFINERQLPQREVNFYTQLLGPILPGSYWLDGEGNYGVTGLDIPLGNLILAAFQSASRSGRGGNGSGASDFPGGGGNFSRNYYSDSTVGSQGGCSYVSFGDGSNYSSGC